MQKIDTHQHLLYPREFGYSWAADFPALQGEFHLDHYNAAAAECSIKGTLFMEVDVDAGQNTKEAQFFCELADDPANQILGVIGKALPEESDFDAQLDAIQHPKLKGIRRVLHTQPDELSSAAGFRDSVKRLAGRGLTFDLCVSQKQLGVALDLVRDCSEVQFILDHCGVPSIAEHTSMDSESWQQWQSGLRAVAAEPNVVCKFSGITAYASPEQRHPDALRPYLNELLEAFGPERIVWGGDWPVCDLADGLPRWVAIAEQLIGELSAAEQQAILIDTAKRIYKL